VVVPHLGFSAKTPKCGNGSGLAALTYMSALGLDKDHFGGRAAGNTRSLHFASLRSG
jgi:hypothetical protein